MRLALLLIALGAGAQASTILTVTGVECADDPHDCRDPNYRHSLVLPVLFSMPYDGCTFCIYHLPDTPFNSQYYWFTIAPDMSVEGQRNVLPYNNHFAMYGMGEITESVGAQSAPIHNPEPGTWVMMGLAAVAFTSRRGLLYRR